MTVTNQLPQQIPSELQTIINRAANNYPEDIDRAETFAYKRLTQSSFYTKELQVALVRLALRSLIHDARHTNNRRTKRQSTILMRKIRATKIKHNKVDTTKSTIIQQMHRKWFEYNINGTRLGSILGKDIARIAEQERSIAGGHLDNARLLEALKPLVPANQKIQDAVTPKKLNTLACRFLKAA